MQIDRKFGFLCGEIGFLCSVFRVGWRIFVGSVFGCGGGIGSLWVAFLDTAAEFGGEI